VTQRVRLCGHISIFASEPDRAGSRVRGSVRFYPTDYRDPNPSFCPAPTGNPWNATNGVRIQW
jgi:hypothetical protein